MSLGRMFTKMAIAFVAGKGIKAYRNSGGFKGIQSKMKTEGGGLDGLLGGLGVGGAASTGGLMGQLARAQRPEASPERVEGLLARTRAADDDEATAGLSIRAMIQAARADGQIDDDEHAALTDVLEATDPDDQHFVDRALNEPVDPAALAAEVPTGSEAQVYSSALLAIDPDNRQEAEFLHALAGGMSLSEDEVNQIHAAMGKPALY